ncbi:MAG: hypothetical protein RMI56_00735 [Sulfolobales archaeon]|nr:hypothetical protein [Sulfolobales archaeon]MDW8082306.1 hypothetical protein [Sulfolobales archaeon]
MTNNLIYVYLSGSHKTIPKAEVIAIAEAEGVETRVVLDLDQLLILYTSSELPDLLKLRSAYSRKIGRALWIGRIEDIREGASRVTEQLHSQEIKSVKLDFRDLRSFNKEGNYEAVRKSLTNSGLILSRESSVILDVVSSQEVVVVGLRLHEVKLKDFFDRWTNRRPVYLPGALNPDISRVFINLSRASIKRDTVFYDPLCGVGSFLLEACYMGLKYLGSDISERSIEGASRNLESYGCIPEVFVADTCRMPVGRVDAIGTDMPYGRQSRPRGGGALDLVKCLIENSESILPKGSYLVFAQSSELEIDTYRIIDKYSFEVVEVHQNWVHGSLTRAIYVLKKT